MTKADSVMASKPLISIICPVYNEEKNIVMFYDRVQLAVGQLRDRYDFEIIFNNNCSTDSTEAIVLALREKDPGVHLITLSRNFGYQASVLCGLTYAGGDASIVIDVDCEDPPELIPGFIDHWEAGYDVVYGIRNRRVEPFIIQKMRALFYWLLQKTGDNDIVMHMAEFALVSRSVRLQMLNNQSTFPFLRTEIGYVGFRRIGIPYVRQARLHGQTHYNLTGMTIFAIGGILSSSTFLLRAAAYVGAMLIPLNALLLVFELTHALPQAFELLVSLDLMYLIFFLAVNSVYSARIYKNGVGRPVFVVDSRHTTITQNHQRIGGQDAV